MQKRIQFALIFALLPLLALVACNDDTAVSSTGRTGLPVADPFIEFYQEYGGQRVFGDPITDAFQPEADAPLVQYFQSMRLEIDNSAPDAAPVSVFPLGEWAFSGVSEPTPAPVPENGQQRFFPETEQTVQDEFLAFYEAHEGERLFGPPISPQLNEGGLRVQYFRNGRLEWRPDLPVGQRVQVSPLGQAHFNSEMIFIYQQQTNARPVTSAGINAADVDASLKYPVLYAGEEQVLYVTVRAPDRRPVAGIPVELTISYEEGVQVVSLGTTDAEGQINTPLTLDQIAPGQQVRLQVTAYTPDGDHLDNTTLSFRIWW